MTEEKYNEIVSTYSKVEIQPDTALDGNYLKNQYMECRICLEEHGPFIAPCKCDGTMKYVHENCLKKWGSQKMKKQVQKDEEKAKGKLASVHGIDCELCRQTISMQVRKLRRFLGCGEAIQNSQQNFLPFLPLVIVNIIISTGCLTGLVAICTFAFMILCQNQSVDHKKYLEHPPMTFGLLGLGLVLCILFMVKSLFQLYHLFIKEEYEIIRVISKLQEEQFLKTQSIKLTLPDFCNQNKKEFNILETMATPTSPHTIADILVQNKFSVTRKNIGLKQKIAKEIAQRKMAKLKEFKVNDEQSIQTTVQSSMCSAMSAKQTFIKNANFS